MFFKEKNYMFIVQGVSSHCTKLFKYKSIKTTFNKYKVEI